MRIRLTVNAPALTAVPATNDAARALLSRPPAAWTMKELNGNEKYVYLSEEFPAESKRPARIHAGDLMLYGTDCIVLFYRDFSTTFRYTPLGRIEDPSGLAQAAGHGAARVTAERTE